MDEEMGWWRRPRLLAAALCVVLGVAVLAIGPLVGAGAAARPEAAPAGEDLALIGDDLALAGEDLAGEDLALLDGPAPAPVATPPPDDLVVYVSGAVAAPDVYRLPGGARVKDAVLAAGGLTVGADPAAVNLAAPLADAQHIHIPPIGAAAPAAAETGAPEGGLIDVNRAGAAELEELPGVGRTLAARIVAHRESQGPFTSVEGLREVTGIGAKLYEQIAPLVTVGQ